MECHFHAYAFVNKLKGSGPLCLRILSFTSVHDGTDFYVLCWILGVFFSTHMGLALMASSTCVTKEHDLMLHSVHERGVDDVRQVNRGHFLTEAY